MTLVAALDREVDVDVRHRDPLGVEEPLEQQAVLEWIDVGDAQREGNDRAGCRAASGTDRDPVVLGELDEVPDDQEVSAEAHRVDHRELDLEPLGRLGRHRVAVALAQPLLGQAAQVVDLARPVRRRVRRDQDPAELDLDVAALGDLDRRRQRLRPFRERIRHLGVVLEVELVRVEAQLRLGERRARLDAEQRAVGVVVLASEVVDIAGGDQRAAELAGDPDDALVDLVLFGDAVLLDLEVDVAPPRRSGSGPRHVSEPRATRRRPAATEPRGEAAGQRDDALGVALEHRAVRIRMAMA